MAGVLKICLSIGVWVALRRKLETPNFGFPRVRKEIVIIRAILFN